MDELQEQLNTYLKYNEFIQGMIDIYNENNLKSERSIFKGFKYINYGGINDSIPEELIYIKMKNLDEKKIEKLLKKKERKLQKEENAKGSFLKRLGEANYNLGNKVLYDKNSSLYKIVDTLGVGKMIGFMGKVVATPISVMTGVYLIPESVSKYNLYNINNQRYDNQDKMNQRYDNQGSMNQRYNNQDRMNQRHDNQGSMNQRYNNQDRSNQKYDNDNTYTVNDFIKYDFVKNTNEAFNKISNYISEKGNNIDNFLKRKDFNFIYRNINNSFTLKKLGDSFDKDKIVGLEGSINVLKLAANNPQYVDLLHLLKGGFDINNINKIKTKAEIKPLIDEIDKAE